MRRLRAACLAAVAATSAGAAPAPEVTHSILPFADLAGWQDTDHEAARDVFLSTCRDMRATQWPELCAMAARPFDARLFFETFFRPVLIENGADGLFTGYFEPELRGARTPDDRFRYPLYALPPEIEAGKPWHSRAEIETDALLADRDLEIAWLEDPVDAFFLQIQGSGRIRMQDGSLVRVGYAGKNGRDYRSIGKELVRRGEFEAHEVSADVIRNWVRKNGEEGLKLLHHNPSYVFFREVSEVPADKGPLGAMNRSITAMQSVAIDPAYVPLGAPVWIEKEGAEPLHRLMIAQDTGSAIKGPQRADIFFGTGRQAGKAAGQIRDPGRIVVLLPIQTAYALVPGS
ncbi:murein transglycosylase [Mesobaculum littorinae]|uniref:peptidoglycan lytic exotransglycosylase n=1 Tax=Mesobaculum littorinae TaxID=2486419 RepID=A0A438AH56_9RHOB|nr:MltA domain-containing protein [Mesobaculum littorinae]RVV98008.1 murein transglycosylase [Mesobaculum littorinae]